MEGTEGTEVTTVTKAFVRIVGVLKNFCSGNISKEISTFFKNNFSWEHLRGHFKMKTVWWKLLMKLHCKQHVKTRKIAETLIRLSLECV